MSFLLSNISGAFLFAATVLNVIKTMGLVALIVVIVFAVIAACVMFVPIRYRTQGDIDEMAFDVRLHWFLKIIMFRFSMKDGTSDYALYLFGIRTKLLDKEAMDKRKRRREKRKAKKAARKHKSRKKKYQKEHDKYKEQFLKEHQGEESININTKSAAASSEKEAFSGLSDDTTDQKSAAESTEDTILKGPKKAMDVAKKVVHILKTIQEYHPIQMLWEDIKKFLYHARPRNVKGDILFGFDDPSMTGKILGAVSNLYFLYQYDDLHINGDFEAEEAYIRGTFDIKGYIQAVFGLIFMIRVIKKKQFRRFLKALKL